MHLVWAIQAWLLRGGERTGILMVKVKHGDLRLVKRPSLGVSE